MDQAMDATGDGDGADYGVAPGVCLTFDDLYVDSWHAALDLFDAYGARVTFCVFNLHNATEDQIAGLREIQAEGHEISFHSRTHPRLQPYLREHGLEAWLANEIDAGIVEHRAAGFPATSFGSPYHACTKETLKATGTRFEVVRAKSPRGVTPERMGARVFEAPRRNNVVHNIGSLDFQHPVQGGWGVLDQQLDAIAARKGVGVFTGHNIAPLNEGKGRFATPEDIGRLLDAVSERGLAFHTLTGFARASRA